MTIGGWLCFGFLVAIVVFFAAGGILYWEHKSVKVLTAVAAVVVIAGMLAGFLWYYQCTAAGQRALVDQRSNLNNGLDRTVTVYTADGDIIAQYTGEIDIEANDGGYVKFDFEGRRYIYYNCFVESIADIE